MGVAGPLLQPRRQPGEVHTGEGLATAPVGLVAMFRRTVPHPAGRDEPALELQPLSGGGVEA